MKNSAAEHRGAGGRQAAVAPRPPAEYCADAAKLWRDVLAGWDLDAPALVLLDSACQALMRVRQAQNLIAKDGIMIIDRFGQSKPHPAVLVERDSTQTLLRNLRALNLDLEPLRDKPGRPPGLGR
jgi:phage terminase small subunit